jgi:hypothetical protein
MTADKLIEQYPIALAQKEGKQIQFYSHLENKWIDCGKNNVTYGDKMLRIKPEHVKRLPYMSEVEKWFLEGKAFKVKNFPTLVKINLFDPAGDENIYTARWHSLQFFCDNYTHLDGSSLYITEN